MRPKTYLATFLLFLLILFLCLGIVSAYMINTQINMSMEKCKAEYQTIAQTLYKDIAVLVGGSSNFSQGVALLVESYSEYYSKNNIVIELNNTEKTDTPPETELTFTKENGRQFIYISGFLLPPYERYKLDYYCDITDNITGLRDMNNILLAICVMFSLLTAAALYFILARIFRPLGIVSSVSQKIAGGSYNERITVKGSGELTAMAHDFNQMAGQIEKQISILEEEAAGKQRFIDNFAHEIRTPLTSIYGNAEYMQKALLDEDEIIELTQSIMDRTSHMKDIAASLLQLATLRDYKPSMDKISLPKLFESINHVLQKTLTERAIDFFSETETPVLTAQEDLIKSLLLNLCQNSVKACPKIGGKINISAKKLGSQIIISVSDNGCGIPEESLSKVTEPFYRVDKARSREQGGSGLGLALCMQIAKVHGAGMEIESVLGMGTTVKVIFTTS